MRWMEVSIETTHDGVDALAARLVALGIEGLQIEDFEDFNEFLEGNTQYWDYVDEELVEKKRGATHIKIYLPDTPDGRDTLAMVRGGLAGFEAALGMTMGGVDEEDWADGWKQYYKPTPIGERLLILPEWEECPDTDRVVFLNNPGMAFGTGTHATTRLALEAVERVTQAGMRVLDMGCGSGILAICALLLGAECADGVDIDPLAADVSRENAARNGVQARYRAFAGNVVTDERLCARLSGGEGYDVVFSNIVADVIIRLPDAVRSVLKPGGLWVASGIIDERLGDVRGALEAAGFEIIRAHGDEGWNELEMRQATV